MPMRPRSGSAFAVRQRKSWSSSSAEGFLKETTWTPCGLTPDMTCSIARVLAGRVHRLEDDEQRVAVARPEQLLRVGELARCPREAVFRLAPRARRGSGPRSPGRRSSPGPAANAGGSPGRTTSCSRSRLRRSTLSPFAIGAIIAPASAALLQPEVPRAVPARGVGADACDSRLGRRRPRSGAFVRPRCHTSFGGGLRRAAAPDEPRGSCGTRLVSRVSA